MPSVTRSAAASAAAATTVAAPMEASQKIQRPQAEQHASPSSSSTAVILSTEPGARLYEQAKAQQARRESLSKSTPAECTFSPTLATATRKVDIKTVETRAKAQSSALPTTTAKNLVATMTKRFEQLDLEARNRATRMPGSQHPHAPPRASQKTGEGPPDSPTPHRRAPTSGGRASIKGEGRSRSTGPVTPPHVPPTPPASSSLPSNRLYAEAARQRERLARRIADTRVPECTFHPTLVSRAASTSRTRPGDRASEIPFVDRAQSYQRHVESKLSALRKEQAAQEQPSFRPTLPVHTGKKGATRVMGGQAGIKRGHGPGETVFDFLARTGTAASNAHSARVSNSPRDAPATLFSTVTSPAPSHKRTHTRRTLSLGGAEARALFARLHAEATQKEEKVKTWEAEHMELEIQGCTFAPCLPGAPPVLPRSSAASASTAAGGDAAQRPQATAASPLPPTSLPRSPRRTTVVAPDVFSRLYPGNTSTDSALPLGSPSSPAASPATAVAPSRRPSITSASLSSFQAIQERVSGNKKSEDEKHSKQALPPPSPKIQSTETTSPLPPSPPLPRSPSLPLASDEDDAILGTVFERLGRELQASREHAEAAAFSQGKSAQPPSPSPTTHTQRSSLLREAHPLPYPTVPCMVACPSLFPSEETEVEEKKAGERQEGMSKSPSRKNMDRGVDKEGGEERAEGGVGPEEGEPREISRSAEVFF